MIQSEQNVKAAKNGNNVVTTIDITLQDYCENTFNSSMKNMPEKKEVDDPVARIQRL